MPCSLRRDWGELRGHGERRGRGLACRIRPHSPRNRAGRLQDGLAREERGWGRGVGGLPRWGGPSWRARGERKRGRQLHNIWQRRIPPPPIPKCGVRASAPLPATPSPRPDVPPAAPPGVTRGSHPSLRAVPNTCFQLGPVSPRPPWPHNAQGKGGPVTSWHPHPLPGWMRVGSSWPSTARKIHPKRGLPPPPHGTVAPVMDKGFGHRPTPEPPGVGGAPRTPPDPPAAPQIPLGAPAEWLQTPLLGELARKGLAPGNKNRLPP